ncbi:hypothetical protein [Breoghania sp. L-A4]|uniref:hypothetical protein n=1 Tax=Breoghania sp. L-A4 TaxID=2304600 RepID=UPI0020BE1FC9
MQAKPADLLAAATAQNARSNAERAQTEGPILAQLHDAGKLNAVAAIYEISTGKVSFL